MTSVTTNVASLRAQYNLNNINKELEGTMDRLSTGKRINSAGDDAAGVSIVSRMNSQINGLSQAIRNANDGISFLQTAEGGISEIADMVQRMRELAVQAANDTNGESDRANLQLEISQLSAEIDRIADNTEWNGRVILNGNAGASAGGGLSAVTFQVGAGEAQTIAVNFGNFTNTDGSMSTLASTRLSAPSIASAVSVASNAITSLDTAMTAVSNQRAAFGAVNNRLIHAVDNLTNISTNAAQTRSRIMDTDYAAATSELARTQIIQQAGTAMLAQANQLPGSVLQLLQN